ncbi:uncharacterized protein LOC116799179 isoform X2 [Chiroxiphia lanceolata]|uniref:uncharacterized protein LOC116799179 isoform X2 n=1 Tax=Chiroxiphia lanceolata TaxID=296741 RepID=UPI0013CE8886|nr:uncharacterized protein LOC116799179 isoform X2 [Chiroxiphia lanceolata]
MRRRRAGPGPGRCGFSRTARGTRGCPRPGRPDPEWEGPVSAIGPRIWPAWPPTAAAALGAKEENAKALQCQPSAPKLWLLLSPDHEPLEPDEDRACQGASAGILEFLQTPNTTHSVCIHVPTPPGLGSLTFPHLLCLWVPHSREDCYSLITDLYNPCNTALTGKRDSILRQKAGPQSLHFHCNGSMDFTLCPELRRRKCLYNLSP